MFTQGQYVRARDHVNGLTKNCDYVVKFVCVHDDGVVSLAVQAPRLMNDPPELEHFCFAEHVKPAPRLYSGELWIDEHGDARCWPQIFRDSPSRRGDCPLLVCTAATA